MLVFKADHILLVTFHMPSYYEIASAQIFATGTPMPLVREGRRESCINVSSRIVLELKMESKGYIDPLPIEMG